MEKKGQHILKKIIWFLWIGIIFWIVIAIPIPYELIGQMVWKTQLPLFHFVEEKNNSVHLMGESPFLLLKYVKEQSCYEIIIEDESMYEAILLAEARDENMVDEQGAVVIYNEPYIEKEESLEQEFVELPEISEEQSPNNGNIRDLLADITSVDELLTKFYTVDPQVAIDEELFQLDTLLSYDMSLKEGVDGPQILIYHTHSQEAYIDSVPGEVSDTVVGAGEYLTRLLESYGYEVLHHTGEYDVISRDEAYTYAEEGLLQVLEEYPTIEVMIDLHRDAVPGGVKLVTDLNGKSTAQFMFFNGLSNTLQYGPITYLPNSYLQDNLAFSLQMHLACNTYFENLTRKIYLKGYRYNMHFKGKSLLIELGAQTNTVEEAYNACEPIAYALHKVLSGLD